MRERSRNQTFVKNYRHQLRHHPESEMNQRTFPWSSGKPNTTSVVTFYNSKGVISTVEWNKFVKTVNKINQSK